MSRVHLGLAVAMGVLFTATAVASVWAGTSVGWFALGVVVGVLVLAAVALGVV